MSKCKHIFENKGEECRECGWDAEYLLEIEEKENENLKDELHWKVVHLIGFIDGVTGYRDLTRDEAKIRIEEKLNDIHKKYLTFKEQQENE